MWLILFPLGKCKIGFLQDPLWVQSSIHQGSSVDCDNSSTAKNNIKGAMTTAIIGPTLRKAPQLFWRKKSRTTWGNSNLLFVSWLIFEVETLELNILYKQRPPYKQQTTQDPSRQLMFKYKPLFLSKRNLPKHPFSKLQWGDLVCTDILTVIDICKLHSSSTRIESLGKNISQTLLRMKIQQNNNQTQNLNSTNFSHRFTYIFLGSLLPSRELTYPTRGKGKSS